MKANTKPTASAVGGEAHGDKANRIPMRNNRRLRMNMSLMINGELKLREAPNGDGTRKAERCRSFDSAATALTAAREKPFAAPLRMTPSISTEFPHQKMLSLAPDQLPISDDFDGLVAFIDEGCGGTL